MQEKGVLDMSEPIIEPNMGEVPVPVVESVQSKPKGAAGEAPRDEVREVQRDSRRKTIYACTILIVSLIVILAATGALTVILGFIWSVIKVIFGLAVGLLILFWLATSENDEEKPKTAREAADEAKAEAQAAIEFASEPIELPPIEVPPVKDRSPLWGAIKGYRATAKANEEARQEARRRVEVAEAARAAAIRAEAVAREEERAAQLQAFERQRAADIAADRQQRALRDEQEQQAALVHQRMLDEHNAQVEWARSVGMHPSDPRCTYWH